MLRISLFLGTCGKTNHIASNLLEIFPWEISLNKYIEAYLTTQYIGWHWVHMNKTEVPQTLSSYYVNSFLQGKLENQWHKLKLKRNLTRSRESPFSFNPLCANSTKWSNTLKQFVGCWQRIVWVCLTILWGWRLKG